MPSQNTPLRDIGGPLKAIGRWMASIDRLSALFRSRQEPPRGGRGRGGRRRRQQPPVMWRRRGVVDDLAPWGVVPCGCCMVLRRLPRRGGSLDCVSFRSGRPHRRGSIALGRRIASGSRHSRSVKCAADRERHHHLLYCLVHCRVPFVIRASPFSRLHRDRTIRREFLTKDFETALRQRQTPVLV